MASSTFSGSPVTVTQLGSGAPLCGKRMSTWEERTRRLRTVAAPAPGWCERRRLGAGRPQDGDNPRTAGLHSHGAQGTSRGARVSEAQSLPSEPAGGYAPL